MANYKTVFSGISGNEKPDTITVVQNAIETDLVFDCYNADGTAYVFAAGDVATAAFIQEGTTTPGYGSTGTITPLVGGSTLTWARAVEDVGTPARYALSFKIVGADTETDWSVPVLYTVLALPGAGDITPPSPLVGVSVAEAAWLTLAAQGVVYADIVQFNELYVTTGLEPVGAQYWDSVREELSFTVDDFGSITIGKEIWDKMTNLSGVQVVNGDVVSTASATGNRQAFTLTDATDTAKSIACIGLVTIPTINNNASGRITKSGIVRGLNTDAFTEGSIVYVDPLNPGKLTQTQPQAPSFSIAIGTVTVKHPTEGIINVNIRIVGKMEDLSDVNGTPLTTDGQFFVWDNASMFFDATANINNYYPKTDFSSSPTVAEPLKADGGGGLALTGTLTVKDGTGPTDLSIKGAGGTNTGMYFDGNILNFSFGGVQSFSFTAGVINSLTAIFRSQYGTEASPAFSFGNDPDTGMYASGGNVLNFATGGTNRVRIDSSGYTSIYNMKSGATQAAAGAAAGELWKTASHATLPDNVVLHGV